MRIEIAERLRPFSHRPGVRCPLPGTPFAVQLFPTRFRLLDLQQAGSPVIDEIELPLRGPLKDYTVQLDLEQGCVRVWGAGPDGFSRFRLQGLQLIHEKGPALPPWSRAGIVHAATNNERLSLGSHRQQSDDRLELRELVPLWLRLAAWMPGAAPAPLQGDLDSMMALVCQPLLMPVVEDELFQGIQVPGLAGNSPLQVLHGVAERLRTLFIEEASDGIHVLPELPVALHCGRFLRASCGAWGEIDFEWSKKQIRRVRFRCAQDGDLPLRFRKVSSCRLRFDDNSFAVDLARPVAVRAGSIYLLDNFQH